MILDLIEKDKNITQREISLEIGVVVSMVNNYLVEYQRKGYINRIYLSTKTVEYFVTEKGNQRKKLLNIEYLNESLKVYNSAKKNIVDFLNQIIQSGFKKVILYGAGEVAEILLQTILLDNEIDIEVLGVIDDDVKKTNKMLVTSKIIQFNDIETVQHDGILISSFADKDLIISKLSKNKYDKEKILNFFEFK
ncbi:winged helix-turn-helix domain-containing protein [Candidatus Izimaplasma bacterium ZiA1]|uniref:winged helix-turn-helix transcriptional regulator n=1 Tax=Candidatus Izimoplasma sp. ZiA1 TaxID=2024899 RepID=UPI00143BF623